jgi:thymidylate synthase ThyX
VSVYASEEFTPAEADVLRRYVTNLDLPVFALVNLPEVVKGALFARYSRSPKSLRRLLLDEFVTDLDTAGDATIDARLGVDRAEALYERVFVEYGDDSVAQLGGVHLACEQASNVLTKILEWGRLASYLEQSTRYIAYDARLGGRYRYFRPPDVLASTLGTRYVGDLDRVFDAYAHVVPVLVEHFKETIPKDPSDSDFVYRQAIRAKAFDAARGLLPAASLSNVGIYASGQAYEALLLRMRAHPLPEARDYAAMMLAELRKVVPSFLRRVDVPERGGAWSTYLAEVRDHTEALATQAFASSDIDDAPSVSLTDFDPDGEVHVVAALLYPHVAHSEQQVVERVRAMSVEERLAIINASVGERRNRRHRPGRGFERTGYRFDVLSDYGAFRDLQRHRLLTIDWQRLGVQHGYVRPDVMGATGLADVFDATMDRSASLSQAIAQDFGPDHASYAVSMAYRIRYVMQMNAREAMHLIELRSAPAGHPAYRRVAQEMHRQIAEVAGHRAIAAAMSFVDHSDAPLERLDGERRAEARRSVIAQHGTN